MGKKLEKWSFGYWLLKQYVIFANWIFHRQFRVQGLENIPSGKPVVYAPNHQNALSDALALVCTVPHQTVWLARADIFRSSFAKHLLHFLKMIPVYRIRDGKENLSENAKTFDLCVRILQNNNALGLFPEAAHSGRRKMLPHKKAVPRIVFLAEEQSGFSLDIQIVPVGIYYDQYHHFGRRIEIAFGKPVPVFNYLDQYLQNQQLAMNSLRNDLESAISSLVVNFEEDRFYDGFEAITELCWREINPVQQSYKSQLSRLENSRLIAGKLNRLAKDNPELASSLASKALNLVHHLKARGLRSWLVDSKEERPGRIVLMTSGLVLTSPLFVFGFFFNILPFLLLDRTIRKKVKQAVFRSTFSFAAGLVVFPMFYIAETAITSVFIGGWALLILFLSLPFAGKFAFSWFVLMLKTIGSLRWLRIRKINPVLYNDLHKKKMEITDCVRALPG
jgi:1-acyl-sn-glycerol-3-phosphate acyltransferase